MTIDSGTQGRASLYITGPKDKALPDLDDLLGIRADEYARIGSDLRGGGPGPLRRDVWIIREQASATTGDELAPALRDSLSRLLSRVEGADLPRKLNAANLAKHASISVFAYCSDVRDVNMWYEPDLLRRLANTGLPLEENFYPIP